MSIEKIHMKKETCKICNEALGIELCGFIPLENKQEQNGVVDLIKLWTMAWLWSANNREKHPHETTYYNWDVDWANKINVGNNMSRNGNDEESLIVHWWEIWRERTKQWILDGHNG